MIFSDKKFGMKKIPVVLLLFSINLSAYAQNLNKGKIEQKNYFEVIPYTIKRGFISVKVSINGKDYNFQFDTGAPFAISEKLCRELGLSSSENIQVSDASGKKGEVNIVSVPKLNLGNITFLNTKGITFSESNFIYDCHNVDGIIGSNILRNSIIQFDSENKQIIITDNAKKLEMQEVMYQKMSLSKSQSNPYINVILKKDDILTNTNALLDSGSDGFFDISNKTYNFIEKQTNVFNKISSNEGSIALGFFGTEEKKQITLVNIPQFLINKFEINNLVATTTSSFNSRIGNQLLKYGKSTLDYKKKRFYFEPYENIETDKLSQKPWAINPTYHNGKLVVGIIWDKSLESLINLGDEILIFDGIDYSGLSLCDIITSEREIKKNSVIIELRDVKTGMIKKVEIKRI